MKKSQISIDRAERNKFADLAAECGLTIGRGDVADMGSCAKLIEAINRVDSDVFKAIIAQVVKQ